MIASVGHQRVFIRSLIYKPPSAFQPMEQLPQVLKTSFSLCPLQKLLPKPLHFEIYKLHYGVLSNLPVLLEELKFRH